MNKLKRTKHVVTKKGGPGGRGQGRPPKFVIYNGRMVQGLSYQTKTQRFYATYSQARTGNRVYFGYEIQQAVREFRQWKRGQKTETQIRR